MARADWLISTARENSYSTDQWHDEGAMSLSAIWVCWGGARCSRSEAGLATTIARTRIAPSARKASVCYRCYGLILYWW